MAHGWRRALARAPGRDDRRRSGAHSRSSRVAAFLLFGGGSDNKPTPQPNTLAQPAGGSTPASGGNGTAKPPAKLVRKDYPLAVLNGTTVTGLARGAADKLTAKGYNEPNVVTNDPTNQTRAVTQIYFESRGARRRTGRGQDPRRQGRSM